jgi:hypothetical protein
MYHFAIAGLIQTIFLDNSNCLKIYIKEIAKAEKQGYADQKFNVTLHLDRNNFLI